MSLLPPIAKEDAMAWVVIEEKYIFNARHLDLIYY